MRQKQAKGYKVVVDTDIGLDDGEAVEDTWSGVDSDEDGICTSSLSN